MNCKQGDMAYIVPRVEQLAWAAGRIVRCVSPVIDKGLIGNTGWHIEPHLIGPDGRVWKKAADASLRPIRDPGDDAQDETLNWIPVPTKEVA